MRKAVRDPFVVGSIAHLEIARTKDSQGCESEIQRVIENWRTAHPFGPGMGGAIGHAAYKVRISTLEGFLRDTVAREGAMPVGLHTLEYEFCGPEVRTFSVNFDGEHHALRQTIR